MVKLFFDRLGIKEISLNINSIGCPVCRAEYNKKLMDYLRPNLSNCALHAIHVLKGIL